MTKFLLSKEMMKKIQLIDAGKKARIFNRAELEGILCKVLATRAQLCTLKVRDAEFINSPVKIDLTAGMPVYRAGPRGGLAIHPAGDWFVFEKQAGKWRLTDCGRN